MILSPVQGQFAALEKETFNFYEYADKFGEVCLAVEGIRREDTSRKDFLAAFARNPEIPVAEFAAKFEERRTTSVRSCVFCHTIEETFGGFKTWRFFRFERNLSAALWLTFAMRDVTAGRT